MQSHEDSYFSPVGYDPTLGCDDHSASKLYVAVRRNSMEICSMQDMNEVGVE